VFDRNGARSDAAALELRLFPHTA